MQNFVIEAVKGMAASIDRAWGMKTGVLRPQAAGVAVARRQRIHFENCGLAGRGAGLDSRHEYASGD